MQAAGTHVEALSRRQLTPICEVACAGGARDASIRAGDIDNVVQAGGATRSPIVRQLVTFLGLGAVVTVEALGAVLARTHTR